MMLAAELTSGIKPSVQEQEGYVTLAKYVQWVAKVFVPPTKTQFLRMKPSTKDLTVFK